MAGKRVTAKKKEKAVQVSSAEAPTSVVELPPDCRLSAQTALKAALLGVLEQGDIVLLDGSLVERIDTAALQLLVVFQREAVARGSRADWRGASAVLTDAADLLGVIQLLKLPTVGSA